ncbi:MAG TPA: GreA/GreB family elongation factor [Burkholderiales bacterium]|nr:GreA/GreB family elongation factor [Burkholderiales bacterium]
MPNTNTNPGLQEPAQDLLVSAADAEVLASIVDGGRRLEGQEAEAAEALVSMLMEARMVPHEKLPPDRVALNMRVTYREEPAGATRTVTLVHPREADPSKGCISVLSPIGRALLGRSTGAVSAAGMPGGRALKVRVLEAQGAGDGSRAMAEPGEA